LEWLATIFVAYERRGEWINTLQDFSFKVIHRIGSMHTNVDVLSRNPMDVAEVDMVDEIQDFKLLQPIQ
jgi:hypothetical protein